MAIDAYLKTAAGQLRRAAQSLKDDEKAVQHDISAKEADTKKTIQHLQNQIHLHELSMHGTIDKASQAVELREVAKCQQEIKKLEAEMEQEKRDKLSVMRNMEQTTEELDSNANALERQPGSF